MKYAYCDICKKSVSKARKKHIESFEKTVWGIITLATLGFGAIAFVIYYYGFKKKIYCATCQSKLKFSKKPFEKPKIFPDKSTPKEKIIKKTGKEKKEAVPFVEKPEKKKPEKKKTAEKKKKEEKIFCPFCGTAIKKDTTKCPSCKTVIERP